MDIIDSDSDLEMAFMEAVIVPSFRRQRKQPVPRQFNTRQFDEDISDLFYRQQHRVPMSVIDLLEERIGDQLQHHTKRNQPLAPRHQVIIIY